MLGGILSLVGGTVGPVLQNVHSTVNSTLETVAPGSTSGVTTTGNVLNENGLLGDLITGLSEGDLIGGIANAYGNIVGPGGAINNLAQGHGLGIEGALGSVLGLADGLLGSADGAGDNLLGGLLGGDGLLGGVLGDGGLLG